MNTLFEALGPRRSRGPKARRSTSSKIQPVDPLQDARRDLETAKASLERWKTWYWTNDCNIQRLVAERHSAKATLDLAEQEHNKALELVRELPRGRLTEEQDTGNRHYIDLRKKQKRAKALFEKALHDEAKAVAARAEVKAAQAVVDAWEAKVQEILGTGAR